MRYAVVLCVGLAVTPIASGCGGDALHDHAVSDSGPAPRGDRDTTAGDPLGPTDTADGADTNAPGDPRGDDQALEHPPVAVAALGTAWVGARLLVNATVGFDGSQSYDPEGTPLTFAWQLTATPLGSGAALTGPATVWPMLTPDLGGDYTVALTVTDAASLTATKSLTVTVEAPYTNAPFNVTVVNYTLSGTDCFTASPVLTGSLTVDRNDPAIVFHFDSSDFVGTIDDQAHFSAEFNQEFNYVDGCRWGSRDRLVGAFTTQHAFWADHSYTEWVLASDGDCDTPCVVSSRIEGTRQ